MQIAKTMQQNAALTWPDAAAEKPGAAVNA
jgi:hypothetical protein